MGFRAQLLRFPDEHLSVVVLCNLASSNPDRLARQVADVYLRDRQPDGDEAPLKLAEPAFVELPAEALERWSGGYRNREDQSVVKISHEDGQLVVGEPRPLRLSPLSPTRFRSVDTPSTELEFGSDEADLRLFVDGAREASYDAVELVIPTPEALEQHEGRYFSEELQAAYVFAAEEGTLTLQRGRLPRVGLDPTVEGEFQTEGLTVVFGPHADARPTGLTAHTPGARNIRFVRVR